MYSPKKPEILNDSELEKFKSICNECSNQKCNWVHFSEDCDLCFEISEKSLNLIHTKIELLLDVFQGVSRNIINKI